MKNIQKFIYIITSLITVVVIGVLILLMQNNKNNNYKCKDEQNNSVINRSLEKKYDCNFTQTWNVVDLIDGYIAEVPEWSYVVLDKFQDHSVYAHLIPTNLKEDLIVGRYYEFTYHIKGTGIINDFEDITNNLVLNPIDVQSNDKIKVILSVKETSRQGMDQIQEDICHE